MTEKLNKLQPVAIGLLRIVAGYMITSHGLDKIFGLLGGQQVPLVSMMGIGGLIELVAGLLILIGFGTRFASFILSGQLAVAYFMFHGFAGNVFLPYVNKGELAALYAFVFLLFVFTGSGMFGIDNLISKKKTR